ncbi:hypothetical protein QBC44DRAFT_12566 [Cladorrhinum sp. PSN332]|nr:hypothetical protein QBC44DRAFT_12566 [Cladorrhinum sp. PSN332]
MKPPQSRSSPRFFFFLIVFSKQNIARSHTFHLPKPPKSPQTTHNNAHPQNNTHRYLLSPDTATLRSGRSSASRAPLRGSTVANAMGMSTITVNNCIVTKRIVIRTVTLTVAVWINTQFAIRIVIIALNPKNPNRLREGRPSIIATNGNGRRDGSNHWVCVLTAFIGLTKGRGGLSASVMDGSGRNWSLGSCAGPRWWRRGGAEETPRRRFASNTEDAFSVSSVQAIVLF